MQPKADDTAALQPTKAPRRLEAVRARARPGRPEGTSSNVRETMLDAAEVIFSELGYAGTTLRMVAQKASVTQALVSYYFGSKYGLFEEVFLRRGRVIAGARMDNLEALKGAGDPLRIRDLVHAFLAPTLALRATADGRAFFRLQARLHTEPPEISYELRNAAYDRSTRAFVEAIGTALPHLPAKDIFWRVTLLIGGYLYAFSDTHRLDQLAAGICDPDDTNEILEQATAFIVGGFNAPAAAPAI
jgi:AcrR family transcriptional regulator